MHTITIVYPTDPLGIVPGGTDTCIRDILRCAPSDINIRLVGVTSDPVNRPVGKWLDCEVSGKHFKFYPLMSVANLERQMRIPLSAQFTWHLLFNTKVLKDSDVLQFNRIEPALATLNIAIPKLLIIHQNMNVLKSKSSDIRWKYLPGLYFGLESFIIRRLKEVFIVREDAVTEYKERFPEKKNHIHFLPTWMNPSLFYHEDNDKKKKSREVLFPKFNIPISENIMTFVGRFDHQKDPLLLIDSIAKVFKQQSTGQLLLIGDGVLKANVVTRIEEHGISDRIHLLGAVSQDEVASYLRASDLLLLSSAYEGMPRCVVEALGCGVPVVTTNVGEVTLLVSNDINGYIVEERTADQFSSAVNKALSKLESFKGQPCLDAVKSYRADVVLKKLYDTYRHYAK